MNKKQADSFKYILGKNNFINCIIDYCKNYKISNPIKIYLVGGFVRDLFNNNFEQTFDLDLAIEGDIDKFTKDFADKFSLNIKKTHNFLNYKIYSEAGNLDIAHCRKETYPNAGALPIWKPANIIEDLFRRDITINAIAIEILEDSFEVIDPLNGIKDINEKIIKIIHSKSFLDDPTRIYRCIKYKARLNYKFETNTEKTIFDSLSQIENISKFRKNNEILKFLDENNIQNIIEQSLNNIKFKKIFPKRFMGKISYIDKSYWDGLNMIYKIFFAMFENDEKSMDEFLSSLNFSKPDKTLVKELFSIKSKLSINKNINIENLDVDDAFISNLYHCL